MTEAGSSSFELTNETLVNTSITKNFTNSDIVPIISQTISGAFNLSSNYSQDILNTTTTNETIQLLNISSWTNVTNVNPNSNLTFSVNESVTGYETSNETLSNNETLNEISTVNTTTSNSSKIFNSGNISYEFPHDNHSMTTVNSLNISNNYVNPPNSSSESALNISATTFMFNLTFDSVANSSRPEKLFVVVAYRNREANKNVFLPVMNSYLTKKECSFGLNRVGIDQIKRSSNN